MIKFKEIKASKYTTQALCFLLIIFISKPSFAAKDVILRLGDIGRYALPAYAAAVPVVKKDWEGFEQIIISIVAVQLATEGLKRVVREPRPDGGSTLSFPSGHVSAAFTAPAFINRRYGFAQSVPLYGLASFVGYSRLHVSDGQNKPAHHVQDVLAGAALAIGMTWLITKPYMDKVNIEPEVGGGRFGVNVSKQW